MTPSGIFEQGDLQPGYPLAFKANATASRRAGDAFCAIQARKQPKINSGHSAAILEAFDPPMPKGCRRAHSDQGRFAPVLAILAMLAPLGLRVAPGCSAPVAFGDP